MANQRLSRKTFNICILCAIIIIILFIAVMFILDYDENGETNMPFDITKITIVSSVDGENVEDTENKWNIDVNLNNDVYIYIEKNDNYTKQETINYVKINNFNITQTPNIGDILIYRPQSNGTTFFQNTEENIVDEIIYTGSASTDMVNLEISNQGGIAALRFSNNNIGTYISNDDEEINYENLLSKLEIEENDLKAVVSFDITIALDSGKVFEAQNIAIQIPNENIVQEGTAGQEYTSLENIVFKRLEN